jgi:hypothetical protein
MTNNNKGTQEKFVVIFIPEPQGGISLAQLKTNMQRLFNMHEPQLSELFAGKPSVVKSNADEDTALMYKRAIERSGGSCWIEPEQAHSDDQLSA